MTATERAAIMRGIYTAFGMFGATFLPALAASDDMRMSLILGGIAAFAALGFRGGVEGAYDSARDKRGQVQPSDVGQPVAAIDPMREETWRQP